MRSSPRLASCRPALLGAAGCLLAAPTPVFANAYWSGFKKYWLSFIADTDGVVITAIVVGLISLFIITRGKWNKSH